MIRADKRDKLVFYWIHQIHTHPAVKLRPVSRLATWDYIYTYLRTQQAALFELTL